MKQDFFIYIVMDNLSKLLSTVFLAVIIIIIAFGVGFWYGQSKVVCQVCPPEDLDFSLFWETWKTLQDKYVDKTAIDVKGLIYGAISGMVDSLNDPYTVFLEPEDAKKFVEDVKGTFEGVGMEVDVKDNQLQVVAPLEGTPAQKAGLRAGDKIMAVDGKSTADITVEEAVSWIRGPKGTEVVLTVFREEWGKDKEVKIIRAMIDIPSLKLEIRDDNIAYLRFYQFSEVASYDFKEAAANILNSDADRIILDLRNNPGGYLDIAQDLAGWFLEKGQTVVIEDFGKDQEPYSYLSQGNSKLLSYPVVILINKGSASASEILAGALRDNRGIKLIGETSFGKGSVQELAELSDGSSLKVTVAKWLTPKGELITDKGLEPDIMVEMTDKDYEESRDPQLDKAVEIIKEMN